MAKRNNSANDLVEILASLPWWVGVVLAGLSYLLFSAIAAKPAVTTGTSGPSINFLVPIASVLRYIAPLVCLLGAVMSVIARAQRKQLLASANQGGKRAVAAMSWREFELLVGEAFRQRGYTVVEAGGGGPDGGVDLLLKQGDERALVQCKHWKTFKVGLPVVREMLGAMTAKRASKGWVITSGRFTDDAKAFARKHGIRLVDGEALPALLDAASRAARAPEASQVAQGASGWRAPEAEPAQGPSAAPSCPVCQRTMVARVAGRGPRAGQQFWGCSGYPGCRGTRPSA